MQRYGLRLLGFVGIPGPGVEPVPPGSWLKSYDPEAHDGRGDAVWTSDTAEAMAFVSSEAAYKCYLQVPKNKPFRDYGDFGPNRPLTAATVMCEELP